MPLAECDTLAANANTGHTQVGSMNDTLIGTTFGSYFVIERLGAGGMASVYRARRLSDNRQVALKILPLHLAASETLRQRFFREAQTAAHLQHPHILPVMDFGEDAGMPYIVMRLVEGGTLADMIRRGPLPVVETARILTEVAEALDHAHTQGVIHRDIKPGNILFDGQNNAFLTDFGIARLMNADGNLTSTGGFLGTAAYASPEQCRGEELTPASDIYSLGVVLYEMLTGVLPFDGPTPLAIIHQHISEPVPNPLKHRPDLPLDITEVMRKSLAKLPGVRYQSARAMSRAVNHALRDLLGAQPLAENAPPIGPNPVFDKPAHSYSPPPPIPDRLLRGLAPTPPAHTSDARPDLAPPLLDPPPQPNRRARLFMWLTIAVMLGTVAALIVVASLR